MTAAFTYCKMEFKRALKIFPVFLTGAVVLAVLLGAIALLAGKVLYGEAAMGRAQVGAVLPADDKVAKQVMDMLSSMDSVESICYFSYMDEEEGRRRLADGSISVLLVTPENFVQSIMDGSNIPVKVILPDQPGIEARVFREMTEAGSRSLGAAQAGIYAADEWLIMEGKQEYVAQAEGDLNRLYLKYSLDREAYFKDRSVSAVGNLTGGEHYAVCFFALFLILGGIPLSGYFREEKKIFYQKLRAAGIGAGVCSASKIAALAFLYGAVSAILVCGVSIPFPSVGAAVKEAGWTGIGGVFFVCGAAAAMVTAVYELCGSRMSGMMALFWGGLAMTFLSGGILPSAFLPESLRAIGNFLPPSYMIKGIERALFSGWTVGDTGKMAAIVLISWAAAAAGRRIHG